MVYSVIGIIAAIIHILSYHNLLYKSYSQLSKINGAYSRFLKTIFAFYLIDISWGLIYDTKINCLIYINTFLYFIGKTLCIVMWCFYVTLFLKLNGIIGKIINYFGVLLFAGEIIALIINIFIPIYFEILENGSYQAHIIRYIMQYLQASLAVILFIATAIEAFKMMGISRRRCITICFFCLLIAISQELQALFPLLPLFSIGMLIGTSFLYTYIIEEEREENRKQLEKKQGIIEGLSKEFYTIWIVNKETLEIQLDRSVGDLAIEDAKQIGIKYTDFDTSFSKYIDTYVEPEDRERLRFQVSSGEVLKQIKNNDIYTVNFLRRDDKNRVQYQQIVFSDAETRESKGQFVFGFRDIDSMIKEEKALKEDLQNAKKAAEAASKSKSIFLNNMTHDIRTPMNAILGYAQIMEKQAENPVSVRNYVKKIEDSGEYLLSIINNILDMAKIESGQIELSEDVMDIGNINASVLDIFEMQIQGKKQVFIKNVNIEHRYIYADKTKMHQLLTNLLSNAIKYTPEYGTIVLSEEEIPTDRTGYMKHITTISDTGIGMSKEFLDKVFDSFTRERTTTESKVLGTGLGMSIVKKIIDLMGGEIQIESEVGKGTTIKVVLEHRIAQNNNADVNNKSEINYDFKGKRILIAEDNDLNAEIACVVLKDAGFMVDRAINGIECVSMLENAKDDYYDLILMDIQMPVLDGYGATERIRGMKNERKAKIKIIAMTANAFEEDKNKAYMKGMNAHVAKPINIKELLNCISEMINE